jgi:hypothetical protein
MMMMMMMMIMMMMVINDELSSRNHLFLSLYFNRHTEDPLKTQHFSASWFPYRVLMYLQTCFRQSIVVCECHTKGASFILLNTQQPNISKHYMHTPESSICYLRNSCDNSGIGTPWRVYGIPTPYSKGPGYFFLVVISQCFEYRNYIPSIG